jgi:GxxExxY protein
MTENEIGKYLIDLSIQLHRKLGPGLLEIVYETILAYELNLRGIQVERQKPIAIKYNKIKFDEAFRIDLFLDGKVIVKIKSVEKLNYSHKKQVFTYLRLTECKLGYLLNFSEPLMKNGIVRIVNQLDEQGY